MLRRGHRRAQRLVTDATAEVALTPGGGMEMVVVGNTIMHHIFLGIDPLGWVALLSPRPSGRAGYQGRDLGLRGPRCERP